MTLEASSLIPRCNKGLQLEVDHQASLNTKGISSVTLGTPFGAVLLTTTAPTILSGILYKQA